MVILGDTWRAAESMGGSVPAVTRRSQGVIDVEPMGSSPKGALDRPLCGSDPIPTCIDPQGSVEDVSPGDIPELSSPSSAFSWAPLYEQHCGPLRENIEAPGHQVADLKRPRSPSFAQDKRVERDALQVPSVENKVFAKHLAPWRGEHFKTQINFSFAAPIDGADSAISAISARVRLWGRSYPRRMNVCVRNW